MIIKSHDIKIDLHVHSPASADYLGTRSIKGYAALVKAFVEEDVNAIAITDHNTINGYLEYKRQVADSKERYRLMAARDESASVVDDLKREVDLFEKLHVFPGVEISAYPSIHLILIFDDIVVPEVSDFLRADLGLGAAVENGDPIKCSKQSVVSILDLATSRFKDRFFCVLPHVESSKGVWKELEGQSRVDLLRDDRVVAAQFLNPDTVSRIKQVLTSKDYSRIKPLGFIQCSDYHGEPSIKPASQYSVVNTSKSLDFDSLRIMLSDAGTVRCSHEFVEKRLMDFVKDRHQVEFEFKDKFDPDAELRKEMTKALCGILNSEHGVVRINLLNVADIDGRDAEPIANLFRDLMDEIDPSDGVEFSIRQFHQSNFRQRFCITVEHNTKLRLMDGICWVVDGTKPLPAVAWRIEQIVATAHYLRVGKKKQKALEAASENIIRVSNAFPAIPISVRLDPLLSKKRCGSFALKMIKPNYPSSLRETYGCENGYETGDFIQIDPNIDLKGGRLDKQRDYFRFSAPLYRYLDRKTEEGETVGDNCVIIFPDGGVNYVSTGKNIFAAFPVIEAKLPVDHELDSTGVEEMAQGFAAWLKSSFLLWYLNSVYQTDDIFEIIIQRRRIPLSSDDSFIRSLSGYAKNIIIDEKAVLKATAKENPPKEDRRKISELILKHNSSVKKNMRLIDRAIYRHLGFTEKEVREVYRVLKALDLYDYEIGSDLEEFIKEYSE
jgi:hypothetical protein